MTAAGQVVEMSIRPRNRAALLRLFRSVAHALLDELCGAGDASERIEEASELHPQSGIWPELRQSEIYVRQEKHVLYVWAWYEVANPRDGDLTGAGISYIDNMGSEKFVISGEDGGKTLGRVTARAENLSKSLFRDWVAIFELIEGS